MHIEFLLYAHMFMSHHEQTDFGGENQTCLTLF